MTSKNLETFNELKAKITLFVAPAMKIAVKDFKSASDAVEARNALKAYTSDLEKRRKELVAPLNAQVDAINDYVKNIKQPMLSVDAVLLDQLRKFEDEQERIRKEGHRKAEEIRLAAERAARAVQEKIARELEEKRLAEIAAIESQHAQAAADFGAEDPEQLAAEKKLAEESYEREMIEAQVKAELEATLLAAEAKARAYDIEQQGIKGARKKWKAELIDIDLVPKEFLIRELNQAAAVAAARGGTKSIPGVRLYQETGIARGRNAYVPREMLEGKGE